MTDAPHGASPDDPPVRLPHKAAAARMDRPEDGSPDGRLPPLLRRAARLVGGAAAVHVADGAGGSAALRLAASHGLPARQRSAGWDLAARAALRTRRPVVVADLSHPPDDLRPTPAEVVRWRTLARRFQTVLAVPFTVDDRTYGALTLFYRSSRQVGQHDLDLAAAVAREAALVVENARLRCETDQRRREADRRREIAEALDDLLAAVTSSRPIAEILEGVLEHACRLLASDAAAVYGRERSGPGAGSDLLHVRASRGLAASQLAARLRVGSPVTGLAVRAERPVVCADLLAALADEVVDARDTQAVDRGTHLEVLRMGPRLDPDLEDSGTPRVRRLLDRFNAVLAVPLTVDDRAEGAVALYYRAPRGFSDDEVALAAAFANRAALAVAHADLRAHADERLRDLEALYRADERLYGSLRVGDVLEALVDLATEMLRADKATVLVWDQPREHLVVGAARGFAPETIATMVHAPGEGITGRVAVSGHPIAVDDALADPRVAHRITDREGIRSLAHVPIVVAGSVFGVFGVNYCQPHPITSEEQRLLAALAHRAALAVENAQLYEASERRSRELATLLEVSRDLVGTLALKPLLGAILDQLKAVMDYGSAAVLTLEGEDLVVQDYRGPLPRDEVVDRRIALAEAIVFRRVVERRAPLIVDDTFGHSEDARLFRRRSPHVRQAFPDTRSWLGVPLMAKDRMIGMLRLDHPEPHRFDEADAAVALAVANQAAIAIENARLYEEAQERATADERQRLARELHDAVSQTLFSASLIAEVLPRVWRRDPDLGLARLEEVRQLTRGALAEMRALLLELRPAALTETALPDLLRQLVEAFVGRTRVPAELAVEGAGSVPPEAQVTLYRIAQEALNNAAKHADARRVSVRLRLTPTAAELLVEDDGSGFDPSTVPPGHLGLGIMQERCARIGADLAVDSHPGGGTRVRARWSALSSAPA